MKQIGILALAAALLATSAVAANAGTTAAITGQITDSRDEPVVDAHVTVQSPAEQRRTKTDATGHYFFLTLPPGVYTLIVEKFGYQRTAVPGIVASADNETHVSFHVASERLVTMVHRDETSTGRFLGTASHVTLDLYRVAPRDDPLFSNATANAQLLQFVPGVTMGAPSLPQ